jgi:GNAT superfamily N-acetyltransferase
VNPRLADASDLETLSAFINSAYRGDSSRAGWTTEADFLDGQRTDPETLGAQLAAPGSVMLMLHDERGALAACVFLQNRGDRAYLGMLTVDPLRQTGGIGKKLMETAEDWVRRNWGRPRLELRVFRQRPELIAWYERRGYRRTGRQEPFAYDDPKSGQARRPDLVFEVLEKDL